MDRERDINTVEEAEGRRRRQNVGGGGRSAGGAAADRWFRSLLPDSVLGENYI